MESTSQTTSAEELLTPEELRLATRNHGLPLEALRYPITPAGLHYLLIHYDIPVVDPATWQLQVDGQVAHPRSFTLSDLRARPSVEIASTMECAGNGRALLSPRPRSQPWLLEAVGTARWRGTPLRGVLEEARPSSSGVEVLFTGLDRGVEGDVEQAYQRSLPLDEAMRDEVLLVYEMNGSPLLPQHGFPLRLLVPGWYGMTNVKWLAAITVLDAPFEGYQHTRYRLQRDEDDRGVPLSRMRVRALTAPPGIPNFHTRDRIVAPGAVLLEGRAWSGSAAIEGVEVTVDGGETWAEADVRRDLDSPWAWCAWTYEWAATPGQYAVGCRARDADGEVQPVDPPWNAGGYANNAVQFVTVTVV